LNAKTVTDQQVFKSSLKLSLFSPDLGIKNKGIKKVSLRHQLRNSYIIDICGRRNGRSFDPVAGFFGGLSEVFKGFFVGSKP
jgi:hypothetical protein